jgi:hypothetical protein
MVAAESARCQMRPEATRRDDLYSSRSPWTTVLVIALVLTASAGFLLHRHLAARNHAAQLVRTLLTEMQQAPGWEMAANVSAYLDDRSLGAYSAVSMMVDFSYAAEDSWSLVVTSGHPLYPRLTVQDGEMWLELDFGGSPFVVKSPAESPWPIAAYPLREVLPPDLLSQIQADEVQRILPGLPLGQAWMHDLPAPADTTVVTVSGPDLPLTALWISLDGKELRQVATSFRYQEQELLYPSALAQSGPWTWYPGPSAYGGWGQSPGPGSRVRCVITISKFQLSASGAVPYYVPPGNAPVLEVSSLGSSHAAQVNAVQERLGIAVPYSLSPGVPANPNVGPRPHPGVSPP